MVQVIEEATGEIVYTLRIKGSEFSLKCLPGESIRFKIGEPGT